MSVIEAKPCLPPCPIYPSFILSTAFTLAHKTRLHHVLYYSISQLINQLDWEIQRVIHHIITCTIKKPED